MKKKKYFSLVKKIFLNRLIIIIIIILIAIIFTILNIYNLQIKNFKKNFILSQKNFIKIINNIPDRNNIFDRNNIPLSINKYIYKLKFFTCKQNNLENDILEIKKIFFLTDKDTKYIIENYKKCKEIIIKKSLNFTEINNFFKFKYKFKNLILEQSLKRYYPYKNYISNILGYIFYKKNNKYQIIFDKKNYIGYEGIEKFYEIILKGKTGIKKTKFDINPNKSILLKPIKNGKNILLTIDINLQKFIYKLINKNESSVIVSIPKNGEIISIISTPNYNNNIFLNKISEIKFNKLQNSYYNPLINRPIQAIYPPASTVKPYISISSIQDKIIKLNSSIIDKGWWKIPKLKKTFYDWKRRGHGFINIKKSIEESSDTFFYKISYKMGINNIEKWMKDFNYNLLTKIDLPNEKSITFPNKKWKKKNYNNPWYIGDTISVGIGQGYWISTPIQMNKIFSTFINQGFFVNQHILKKINYKNINLNLKNLTKIIKINKKKWYLIKKAMYGVAHNKNGTAYKNFIKTKYKIGAKSGTAQVFSLKNYSKYLKSEIKDKKLKDHTMMNIYIPYKKPKFAITIILEHGGYKDKIGNIMRKITDYLFKNNLL